MLGPIGMLMQKEVDDIENLLRTRRVVVLTGAGCSTESGIPDYRGEGRPAHPRVPIQHRDFITNAEVQRRYWARATLGWAHFRRAQPNAAHRALAELERDGYITGIITQNVDRLHQAAGSRRVVELHGALADVVCLQCERMSARDEVHARLLEHNPRWLESVAELRPDGDAELAPEWVREFRVVGCTECGGALKPAVVFFGGSVEKSTLARAWELFDEAEALLVLGSSLAVYSGFRFARRAAQTGRLIAVINQGKTRADDLGLVLRSQARLGELLPLIATRLVA